MSNTQNSASNVVNFQAAAILKGYRSWGTLSTSAVTQRQLWLDVGVALMYGKVAENRPEIKVDSRGRTQYQKLGEWRTEMFPGLTERYASAAIWAAENSAYYADSLAGVSDPIEAQRMHSLAVVSPPTPELTIETPDRLVASIEHVGKVAKVINKLAAMADRGEGQEKATSSYGHGKSSVNGLLSFCKLSK